MTARIRLLIQKIFQIRRLDKYWQKTFEKSTSIEKLEKARLFSADEISQIYELPFKPTLDVEMPVFQFKINHNILYTKVDFLETG